MKTIEFTPQQIQSALELLIEQVTGYGLNLWLNKPKMKDNVIHARALLNKTGGLYQINAQITVTSQKVYIDTANGTGHWELPISDLLAKMEIETATV